MNVELDVLGLAMMNWIGEEIDSQNVVAVHNGGIVFASAENAAMCYACVALCTLGLSRCTSSCM
jgi:hypothetical protein